MLVALNIQRKRRPLGRDTDAGAVFTVRPALRLVTPLKLAVILELPADCPVASPAALMVATVGLEEFQIAWLEMSCVVVS
jgi:hypothetical protein